VAQKLAGLSSRPSKGSERIYRIPQVRVSEVPAPDWHKSLHPLAAQRLRRWEALRLRSLPLTEQYAAKPDTIFGPGEEEGDGKYRGFEPFESGCGGQIVDGDHVGSRAVAYKTNGGRGLRAFVQSRAGFKTHSTMAWELSNGLPSWRNQHIEGEGFPCRNGRVVVKRVRSHESTGRSAQWRRKAGETNRQGTVFQLLFHEPLPGIHPPLPAPTEP